jgi:hypothetical protein
MTDVERAHLINDYEHLIDDYEKSLAKYRRTIDEQAELLTLALHACRAKRYAVTDEFIGRVIDALSAVRRNDRS